MTSCKNQQRDDDQSPHWQEKRKIENLPTSPRHRNDLRFETPSTRFREDTSIEFTRRTCMRSAKAMTKDFAVVLFSVESVIILVLGLCGKLCVPLEKFSQLLRTVLFLSLKTKKTLRRRIITERPAQDSERTHQLSLHDVRVCVPPRPGPRISQWCFFR